MVDKKDGPSFQRVYLDDVLSEDERMLRFEAIADPHTQTPEQIYIHRAPADRRGPLTEPMFYILMSFLKQERCGIEITEFVTRKTHGRVRLGPGTLYTLLGKFQEEKLIEETRVAGRKRTYRLTGRGREAYLEELERLRTCICDGEEELL